MAESFIGEIRMFAGPWAPKNWAYCDGQLVPVSQNPSLFALLGTTYGGDGYTTFGLPDMRGRLPVHMGAGPNLTPRLQGQMLGVEWAYLTTQHVPPHDHAFMASSRHATDLVLTGRVLAKTPVGAEDNFYAPPADTMQTDLIEGAILEAGDNQPHTNLMPYLAIHFIIALKGEYPQRS